MWFRDLAYWSLTSKVEHANLPQGPTQFQGGYLQTFTLGRKLCQHTEVILLIVSAVPGSCVLT